jgi:ribonuclease J
VSASVEFWGGVGVIGSSKVLIKDGGHRVLLDLGLDIPKDGDLFRLPAAPRPGRELSDRLRVGAAPAIPGLFDPTALAAGDPLGAEVEPTALFVTHPHIDHVGLVGFVRPEVPVHASPDTIALLAALEKGQEPLPGPRSFAADSAWRPVALGEAVRVGPMTVERFDVDHDVPGASGYRVTTGDGVLVFTGDFRFHGHRPELSWGFAEAVAGADVLVTEGTTLSWEEIHPLRTEVDVNAIFDAELAGNPDLVLLAVYPRDFDRVRDFMAIAEAAGRYVLWPDRTAAFLRAAGFDGALAVGEVGLDAVRETPGRYVLQFDADDIPSLLDMPFGPHSVFVHANGEPLGPFEPRWQLFVDWLAKLGVPLRRIGCSGHAYQDDLHEFVRKINPRVLIPIHTFSPYRVHPTGSTARLVVDYARAYDFDGRPLD